MVENEMRNRKIPNISPYGNYVFAYLSQFIVCNWEDDKIIVNGTVTIEPPYGESNIKGNEKDVVEVKEWVCICLYCIML